MSDLSIWQHAPLGAIIDHILPRYHETHRRQLDEILPLADKVARVHAETFPPQLLPLVLHMDGELRSHMMKEERMLFPMIKQGLGRGAAMPINVMMHEHDDHDTVIHQLIELTDNFTPPAAACGSWQRLYAQLQELVGDLRDHIELENEILFARTLNA